MRRGFVVALIEAERRLHLIPRNRSPALRLRTRRAYVPQVLLVLELLEETEVLHGDDRHSAWSDPHEGPLSPGRLRRGLEQACRETRARSAPDLACGTHELDGVEVPGPPEVDLLRLRASLHASKSR